VSGEFTTRRCDCGQTEKVTSGKQRSKVNRPMRQGSRTAVCVEKLFRGEREAWCIAGLPGPRDEA